MGRDVENRPDPLEAARNMAEAAAAGGLEQIIYLSGLGEEQQELQGEKMEIG